MRLFKQDGDRHEFAGHALTIAMALCVQKLTGDLSMAATVAIVSTTSLLLLSPDVDQARSGYKSKALHRWKRAGLLWWWHLFQMLPGTHHRGITHYPIVGAAVVVAWGCWPLLLLPGAIQWVAHHWSLVVVPCAAQQLLHLALDGEI